MSDTLKPYELDERDKMLIYSLAKNNMNVSDVSRELFMHRNTVVYNLERIKRKTGLSPFSFGDLVKLVKKADGSEVYYCPKCGAKMDGAHHVE